MPISYEIHKTHGRKVAYLFNEVGPSCPQILGPKVAGLVELVRLGAPVPPGYAVTSTVSRALSQHGRMPNRVARQLRLKTEALERLTGKRFGHPANPLLLAVRPNVEKSMTGVLGHTLGVGMTEAVVRALVETHGAKFAWGCYKQFLRAFGLFALDLRARLFDQADMSVHNLGKSHEQELEDSCRAYKELFAKEGKYVPEDPWQQLEMALLGVLKSWYEDDARYYRRGAHIPESMGMGAVVQEMVFGNRDKRSAVGYATSHDMTTGDARTSGEFLDVCFGDDWLSGLRDTRPFSQFERFDPDVCQQIDSLVQVLALRHGKPMAFDFIVDAGKLCVVQLHEPKPSVEGEITIAVRKVWAKQLTKQAAVASVNPARLKPLMRNGEKKEISIFMRWRSGEAPKVAPQLVPVTMSEGFDLSRAILDCYLTKRMAETAKGTTLSARAEQLKVRFNVETAERFASCVAGTFVRQVTNMPNQNFLPEIRARMSHFEVYPGQDSASALRRFFDNVRWNGNHVAISEFMLLLASDSYHISALRKHIEMVDQFLQGRLSHVDMVDRMLYLEKNERQVLAKGNMWAFAPTTLNNQIGNRGATDVTKLYQYLSRSHAKLEDVGLGWLRASAEVDKLFWDGVKKGLWTDPNSAPKKDLQASKKVDLKAFAKAIASEKELSEMLFHKSKYDNAFYNPSGSGLEKNLWLHEDLHQSNHGYPSPGGYYNPPGPGYIGYKSSGSMHDNYKEDAKINDLLKEKYPFVGQAEKVAADYKKKLEKLSLEETTAKQYNALEKVVGLHKKFGKQAVVFIDEIDTFSSNKNSSGKSSLLNEMLEEMDLKEPISDTFELSKWPEPHVAPALSSHLKALADSGGSAKDKVLVGTPAVGKTQIIPTLAVEELKKLKAKILAGSTGKGKSQILEALHSPPTMGKTMLLNISSLDQSSSVGETKPKPGAGKSKKPESVKTGSKPEPKMVLLPDTHVSMPSSETLALMKKVMTHVKLKP